MPSIKDTLSEKKLDLFQIEKEVKEYWDKNKVYEKIRRRKGKEKFYFLDGPPYASAKSIHVGTAWNKVIKDIVIRYYRMKGFDVWDQPGYDTHGLPIEVLVEKKLGISNKKEIEEKVGVEKFVKECKKLVDENIQAMTNQFKEIGASFDWDNPYITYKDEYIESGWWLIKKAWEKGLLGKDLRVVHWCPRCETTLADYEVSEYRELEDPSIYVKFALKERENEFLLIWTTTPWTLPANTFVMAHPEITYVKVKIGNEYFWIAKPRLEPVLKEAGIKEYGVVEEKLGKELEGLEYVHPLEKYVDAQNQLKKYHRIILAPEAVTAHEGTGFVHSAPGHGDVDYQVALENSIPVVSLVDDHGKMVSEAGVFKGLYFRGDANAKVIEILEKENALFFKASVKHRYPVCWRCKTPLLLRATQQWVIKVTKLKSDLIREAEKINWIPDWAKPRFLNMLKNLRDWVISRQRYWGIPIPLWTCRKCGKTIVVGSVEELRKLGGETPKDLHRPWVDKIVLKCPDCGGEMKRIPDVADVWFDSGISFYASLGYPRKRDLWEKLKPVDFIVEGHDQIRGWFFSLLRSGIIGFNERPYKTVLVHGFMLDEKGREMHKSLGNYVEFNELIQNYPRDVVRFWLLLNTVWEDLRFSFKGLEQMKRDFTVIWNVFSFAATYMSLDKFDPAKHTLEKYKDYLGTEDKWLLSRLESLVKEYYEAMESYELHRAARLLRAFIVDDVSHWYIKTIRRKVWTDIETPEKMATYAALYTALKKWLLLSAPFIPFLTEYLYIHFLRQAEEEERESIHMLGLPDLDEKKINKTLEKSMEIAKQIVEAIASLRMKAGINIRRPLWRVLYAPINNKQKESVKETLNVIKELSNVKEIVFVEREEIIKQRKVKAEPIYKAIGPKFRDKAKLILNLLEKKNEEIANSIREKGSYTMEVEGEVITLTTNEVELKVEDPEWMNSLDTEIGVIAIDTRLPDELVFEGITREIVRRIQQMRKEQSLNVEDRIFVSIEGEKKILQAVAKNEEYLRNETRAVKVAYETKEQGMYCKKWELDEGDIDICIRRV